MHSYAALDAAKAKKPDIILNSGHLIEAIAITKAARDVRLDAAIFAYTSGPATPDFAQALGKDANTSIRARNGARSSGTSSRTRSRRLSSPPSIRRRPVPTESPRTRSPAPPQPGWRCKRRSRVRTAWTQREFVMPLRHWTWSRSSAASSSTNTARTSPRRCSSSRFKTASWRRSGRQRWPPRLPCTQHRPGRRARRALYRRNRRPRRRSWAIPPTDLQEPEPRCA